MSFEQHLDGMIRNLLNGWDGVDNAGVAGRAAAHEDQLRLQQAAAAEAKIVADALANPAGQKLLELLLRKTCLRSESFEARTAKSAEHYALLAKHREGQRDLVFMLLNMLRVATGGEPEKGGDT